MGIKTGRENSALKVKNKNGTAQFEYRMNDEGVLERVEITNNNNTIADSGWDFDSINDDYYNAWNEFEGIKSQINADNGFESIDINAFGVGVIVEQGKNKFRHEVSSDFCTPPCEEFIKTGDCKHVRAMKAHNDAMKELQEKIGDASDPDAAFNRFDSNFSNPENIVLMVEDQEALLEAINDPDKFDFIMLAKDADGHPAIFVRPAGAEVNEDGSSPDDRILTELSPAYAEKIEGMDIIGPDEGVVINVQKLTLTDGKEYPVAIVSEFDLRHKKYDEIKENIVERIEGHGKTGAISAEEGLNSNIDRLVTAASRWPQLPQEYHDLVDFGRNQLTTEELNGLSPEDRERYRVGKEIAERIPKALDKTFSMGAWETAVEQFGAYYTERKTGQDILSVDLFGPFGSGKTYFAEVIAEVNNQPFYKIEAHRGLDLQQQLVVTTKKYNPETGQSELTSIKAGLAEALEMSQGSVVLIDESVHMDIPNQRLLNGILANSAYVATESAEDGFTTHPVNRKTILFTAHNTTGGGDGVAADNDPSLSSRQATAIYFQPASDEFRAIAMAKYAANHSGEKPIDPKKAMLMVKFSNSLIPLYTGEGAEQMFRMPPNDPRDEKRMGDLLAKYCHDGATENELRTFASIVMRTAVNKYTDKSEDDIIPRAREAVMESFIQVMHNPAFPFKWPEMVAAIERGVDWGDGSEGALDGYNF